MINKLIDDKIQEALTKHEKANSMYGLWFVLLFVTIQCLGYYAVLHELTK